MLYFSSSFDKLMPSDLQLWNNYDLISGSMLVAIPPTLGSISIWQKLFVRIQKELLQIFQIMQLFKAFNLNNVALPFNNETKSVRWNG